MGMALKSKKERKEGMEGERRGEGKKERKREREKASKKARKQESKKERKKERKRKEKKIDPPPVNSESLLRPWAGSWGAKMKYLSVWSPETREAGKVVTVCLQNRTRIAT